MSRDQALEAVALISLFLAVSALLFIAFVDAIPFSVLIVMQLLVIAVGVLSHIRCKDIVELPIDDNFMPAIRLLPRRYRVLVLTAAALGVTPLVIFGVSAPRDDGCYGNSWFSSESCSVTWREERGAYWKQVNESDPIQVTKTEYHGAMRDAQLAFAGMWISFASISLGMATVARHDGSPMAANSTLQRTRRGKFGEG